MGEKLWSPYCEGDLDLFTQSWRKCFCLWPFVFFRQAWVLNQGANGNSGFGINPNFKISLSIFINSNFHISLTIFGLFYSN